MKANIIGTGRMAKGIIGVLAKAYPGQIGLYSRDFNKAQMVIDQLEIEAKALSKIEQFDAEIIIHTLWYEDVLLWVQQHKEKLKGKVLVDISNPFNEDFTDFITPYNTSSAEEIQKLIPETHVVGAFKNTYWVVFNTPDFGGILSDIYVTANETLARNKVMALLAPLPFRIFDAGLLINSRTIERMTLLEKELAMKKGNHPRVSFHLWGFIE
ncbi:NADPH-dependent F420 reductase [Catalinimonas niigatensis]|uniref:NADPH-dependent F420 reductase n=1 Tax=Catalinimonas niigatensis TaxID=1397264 RepID=UPI002664EFF9|nr:NAD(P)-binding domain-containing protein [Catalinimonas niigatensis]WPP51870.1 NAD(P)-binding domain-containing protein [Catalinimonas niigatensis]